jgi:hypothetical protein
LLQGIDNLGHIAIAARDEVAILQNFVFERVGSLAYAPYTKVL